MIPTKKKDKLATLCIVLAVLSLVFAIICFATETSSLGGTEPNKSYGGDAYTGIQNAAAQTANNVYYLNKSIAALTSCVATASGFFFLLVAATFGLVAAKRLGKLEETPAPQQMYQAPVPPMPPVPPAPPAPPVPPVPPYNGQQ